MFSMLLLLENSQVCRQVKIYGFIFVMCLLPEIAFGFTCYNCRAGNYDCHKGNFGKLGLTTDRSDVCFVNFGHIYTERSNYIWSTESKLCWKDFFGDTNRCFESETYEPLVKQYNECKLRVNERASVEERALDRLRFVCFCYTPNCNMYMSKDAEKCLNENDGVGCKVSTTTTTEEEHLETTTDDSMHNLANNNQVCNSRNIITLFIIICEAVNLIVRNFERF